MMNGKKYKVGMYGGAFCPLHLGHLTCMIKAAALCERLYIVISYRNHPSDIDVKVKIRWVYQLTKHLGNIEILTLEDTLDNKEDYTEEYWQQDCAYVKQQIGTRIDVVFCGNDYDEGSFWNQCYQESELIIFPRSQYNFTAIREDIYGHWDWMPQIVRSHFVKKVLLI